jgi:hypothetical protein
MDTSSAPELEFEASATAINDNHTSNNEKKRVFASLRAQVRKLQQRSSTIPCRS